MKRNLNFIIILFLLLFSSGNSYCSTPLPVKYNLGDGIIQLGNGKNSINCVLLLTQIYCKRNNIDFKKLYLDSYPGADTIWMKSLEKDYGPFTAIPERIDGDALIAELVQSGYSPLADKLCIMVNGYSLYDESESSGSYNDYSGWPLYIIAFFLVVMVLFLLRYKEKFRWAFRNLRKSAYDLQTVDGCIKALKDKDQLVRASAVETLGKIGDDKAIDALLEALNDNDVWVKKASILELGKLKTGRAIPFFMKLLDDKTGFIVSASAYSLSLIGDKGVIEPLKEKAKALKSHAAVKDIRNAIKTLEAVDKK